jgi:hypothetical protein
LRREGQRHYDLGVATKIELRDGNYNGKGQETDGGGEGIGVIQKIQQRGVFSDRREAKFSSGGEQVQLFQSEDTKPTEADPRARAIPNYFPAQGEGAG